MLKEPFGGSLREKSLNNGWASEDVMQRITRPVWWWEHSIGKLRAGSGWLREAAEQPYESLLPRMILWTLIISAYRFLSMIKQRPSSWAERC